LTPRTPEPTSARELRALLARPGIIRSLGAHDVLTALVLERAGLELLFAGGFGVSASAHGLPDLGFLGLAEITEAVRRMAARTSIPIVADADTGYGDLHNVQRTVEELEAAGPQV
jgi:2-methylisocitrate lyase-like PEP mutase family enzyme